MRKIVHLDMDAFYASVEQRDQPHLRGRPVAVGYAGDRGVVMTASYEARRFGVGSAMPVKMALERCRELVLVPPRMEVYRSISAQIREIFFRYTDLVEPLSLDEAYLDVSQPKQGSGSATLLAKAMKQEVYGTVGLTISAGVAATKFLAKIASGLDKPDGLTVITPDQAWDFIATLPIESFFGIGPKTAARMHQLGISRGQDLRAHSQERLEQLFGKQGRHFWQLAQGIDERKVDPNRDTKSISAETTFLSDLGHLDALVAELPPLAAHVAKSLTKHQLVAKGVMLKLKYSNHQLISRHQSLPMAICEAEDITKEAVKLLRTRVQLELPIRLLGVAVFKLQDSAEQLVTQGLLFVD